MEVVSLLIALLNNLGPRLLSLVQKKYDLYKRFEGDVTYLRNKLPYITTAVQLLGQNSPFVEELSRLVHDIEDCIDHINYRAIRIEHGISVSSRNRTSIEDIDKEMGRLKTEVQRLQQGIDDALAQMDSPMTNPSSTSHSHLSFDRLVLPEELFGMKVPMEELQEQLVEVEPKQLKVISIVGFCGLGKTLLAHRLYESPDGKKFEERIWVSAAHGDSRVLLREILSALDKQPPETSDVFQLSTDLREHLHNKRYFIVIDDMRTDLWNTIKSAFPSNQSSRVVVTTRFQSVATICSRSTNGYIHKIQRLDEEHSKQLFLKNACPVKDLDYPQPDSAAILKKCDGQPLALTTVGEFMQKEGWPKGPVSVCQEACSLLRSRLDRDNTLKRLHELLINDYSSLPTHDHKACLLYFAMFPSDHPIRTKRLMRRWLAEGLLKPSNSGSDLAVENLKMLMDQNIIEPIDVSNNMAVRTCKTYGMMHEYIMLKSHSENIIALFGDGCLQPKRVRRLSLHDSSITDGTNLEYNLSLVRSLIVTGNAENAMLDLRKYQLLRVLDLEQCTKLQNENLKELCNLLLLKYLSLGVGVTNLPKKIKQLKLLETLDLRRSGVRILRPEVIMLPNLVNLFGKFKLQKKVVLASGQCKLQNLAGFLVDESKGFVELISQMKKLRKVKIWCESSATHANLKNLKKAIQNFIDDANKSGNDPRSLSVHFEGCSEDLLEDLHGPCYLGSLKLHGKLLKLPGFINKLRGLTELCLQSSSRFTADLLTALCDLKHLRYLKLIAEELDEITIKDRKLRSLLCLCFVLERPKTFPKIEEGCMSYLESLQLLCKDLDGLSGIQIKSFPHLKEVILDNRVINGTKSDWVRVAKEHPNRPKVMLKRVVQQEVDLGEDSGALDTAANQIIESPFLTEESVRGVDTQMPPGEPNSDVCKITGHPVVCAALSGLSISGNNPRSS